jgi:hypothetical protein
MSSRWLGWTRNIAPCAAAWGLNLAAAPTAGAQPLPAGEEFQINTYTTDGQQAPSVAADSDGDFVVVWYSSGSSGTDTSFDSIQGQRYASNGAKLGAEFQVNTYTTNTQRHPSVAADADGDFVVVWESPGSFGTDTGSSAQGQRYASDGSARGAQFQVNSYTTNSQDSPSVAVDADGDFVVVWTSWGSYGTDSSILSIQGQRYASNGATLGAEFQVNTYTTNNQDSPSVAVDAEGDFVVAWSSAGSPGTDTSLSSIQGQRYASNGSTLGAEFQVNTYTTSYQANASVAVDADGDFVVVWISSPLPEDETSHRSVQGQRYASDGSTQGVQFQVSTDTLSNHQRPSAAADADGNFVVVWHVNVWNGHEFLSVQAQRYASGGSRLGGQFQVNTYTTYNQKDPSVSMGADGGFVVAWGSNGSFGSDTSYTSIQGQRFRTPPSVPAMSLATRFAFGVVLLLLGTAYALRRSPGGDSRAGARRRGSASGR